MVVRHLVRALLVAGAVSFVAMSANAADMYRAPDGGGYKDGPGYAPVWTGPYAGVNGGFAWGGNSDLVVGANSSSFAASGAFGGGQIGYNWQGIWHPHLVLGIEADIDGANITGSTTLASDKAEVDLNWFGTVRGRIGYAMGQALIYGTGGLAFGGVDDKLTVGGKTTDQNSTKTGYAAGGGVEYAFNRAWSGKVEYLYIDLDAAVPPAPVTVKFDNTYSTVRAGINYHVGSTYEPLK